MHLYRRTERASRCLGEIILDLRRQATQQGRVDGEAVTGLFPPADAVKSSTAASGVPGVLMRRIISARKAIASRRSTLAKIGRRTRR